MSAGSKQSSDLTCTFRGKGCVEKTAFLLNDCQGIADQVENVEVTLVINLVSGWRVSYQDIPALFTKCTKANRPSFGLSRFPQRDDSMALLR
jgi:hypothetical protein